MSAPISLREVPGKLLNRGKWNLLRKFASKDIIALSYINAPYPDEEDPSSFFWDRRGSGTEAVRCYRTGRSILGECRSLLNSGNLVASGVDRRSGERRAISASEWVNLWPMFATNKATGPDNEYDDVQVFEAISADTPHEKLSDNCIGWLKEKRAAGITEKKFSLYHEARRVFGNALTHAIFDAAYLAAFARGRGRPKGNTAKS
jgi:hypothetical protein